MSAIYPHPSSSLSISLDPTHPGTPIRIAFVAEAILNVLAAIFMFLSPSTVLGYLATSSSPTLVTPLSATVIQIIAGIFMSIAVPLLLAVPNTRQGIESRGLVYIFLAATEVCLVGGLAYIALFRSEKETGVRVQALWGLVSNLIPPLAFRLFVLGVKPHWMGRYRDGTEKKRE